MEADARPIYVTIAGDLRQEIAAGTYGLGDQIPTEAELCKRYGVSRMTVRQALDSLVASGYLKRRRGKGTFVSSDKAERSASRLLGFEEDTRNRGLSPATSVLGSGWHTANAEERQLLDLSDDSRVLRIDRLRTVNDEPIGINHIVLLEQWGNTLGGLDFSNSLYTILKTNLADEVKEAEQRIEAVPATTDQAASLQVGPGAPLLRIVRTTYLERHGLIGLTRTFYRGDRYYLSLKVSRESLNHGGPLTAATTL